MVARQIWWADKRWSIRSCRAGSGEQSPGWLRECRWLRILVKSWIDRPFGRSTPSPTGTPAGIQAV